MFEKSQRFYDAIYGWKDYADESERLVRLIRERAPGARTLLDVACGTGKHLEHLKTEFEVEGLDLDEEMLEIARTRNPDVRFHVGSMLEFDLGRRFDVVACLFSSIAYMRTPENLDRAVATMAGHLQPGGLLVVEPFFTPDTWEPGQPRSLFVDQENLKIARMDVPGADGNVAIIDFHYLVGTPEGIEHFTEQHELGLFTDEEYRGSLAAAGLVVEHDPEGLFGRGLFIGSKPTA